MSAEDGLVNLAAGNGYPAEIMDMSFAIWVPSARYPVENEGKPQGMLIDNPEKKELEIREG